MSSHFWQDLLQALFPFHCLLCSNLSGWRQVLCPPCSEKIRQALFSPRRVTDVIGTLPSWTVGSYDGLLAQAIKAAKYRPSRRMAQELGALFELLVLRDDRFSWVDLVVPVPLHVAREGERGFNQARIFAEAVAKALNCPVCPAITRLRSTRPQAECDENERTRNLQGVFGLHPRLHQEVVRGKRVLLIDDVATTGHTLEECTRPLRELPCARVEALVLAHSFRRVPAAKPILKEM